MRIDICQTDIVWENKEENIKKAEKIVSESKADILLFPEMSFTGFSMNTALTGENDCFTISRMKEISRRYNKAIGFGWVCKEDKKAENHYTVVNGDRILSDYVKIHPFSYSNEDKYFRGGDKLGTFEFSGFEFMSAICYDLRFPEIFRVNEPDIIIVPANWPADRSLHWATLLRARAIENRCYCIGINCYGSIGGIQYSGGSTLINPDGKILYSLEGKEGVISAEIQNDVTEYRKSFPVLNDKRNDVYKKLRDD